MKDSKRRLIERLKITREVVKHRDGLGIDTLEAATPMAINVILKNLIVIMNALTDMNKVETPTEKAE